MFAKRVLFSAALIGFFALGTMYAAIGETNATKNEQMAENVNAPTATQTAVKQTGGIQQGNDNFICPMTGEAQVRRGPGVNGRAGGNRGAGVGPFYAGAMHQVVADELGITVEELLAARYAGASIADLAEEKGVNLEELLAVMIATRKVELEQLVNEGQLTEAQMAGMLTNMEARMRTAIESDTIGTMNGRGGQGKGQGGRWNSGS